MIDTTSVLLIGLEKLNLLKGKEVRAFGLEGQGIWGRAETMQLYVIEKIELTYADEDEDLEDIDTVVHGNINVFLKGYNASQFGLIYTDRVFIQSLRDLIVTVDPDDKIEVDYSEQGMQSFAAVNLDIMFGV